MQFALNIPADANLGGLVFDERGVHSLIPIGPLDQATLRRAMGSVSAGGSTPLAQAIRDAYYALTQRAMSQLGYGEYHLVVVTDGEATGEDPRGVVNRLIAESPVVLHTIGFCIGDKHSLNQPGRTIYHAADSPRQLAARPAGGAGRIAHVQRRPLQVTASRPRGDLPAHPPPGRPKAGGPLRGKDAAGVFGGNS